MNRVSKLGLAAMCSLAAISVGMAQMGPQSPEQRAAAAVKVRQGLFEVQNFSFAPAAAVLRGAPLNAQAVQVAAKRIQMTSSMIPDVFKFDTRKFMVNTKARDDIWASPADFQMKADALNMAAQELEMVAASGDAATIKPAIIKVGKACGSCHDQFRNK
jgi:cytochrome c556